MCRSPARATVRQPRAHPGARANPCTAQTSMRLQIPRPPRTTPLLAPVLALTAAALLLAVAPAHAAAQQPPTSAGRDDPLDALRRRSSHVVLPAGARYDSSCSRALGTGAAIFSIGPDGELGMAAVREAAARPARSEGERTINVFAAMQRGPAWQAFSDATRFYVAQGFRHTKSVTTSARLERPEAEADPLVVTLRVANLYVDRPGCEHVRTAIIELGVQEGGR